MHGGEISPTVICDKCGGNVTNADDMNAIMKIIGFAKEETERLMSRQGNSINTELKKLSLALNTKKTQFTVAMLRQRRRPSRSSVIDREERGRKININIDGNIIEESTSMKTLGVRIDGSLNFLDYWEEITKPINVS